MIATSNPGKTIAEKDFAAMSPRIRSASKPSTNAVTTATPPPRGVGF